MNSKNISLTYNDFLVLKSIDYLKKRNNFNHLINSSGYYDKNKVNDFAITGKSTGSFSDLRYLDLLSKLNLKTKNEVNLMCLTYSYFLKLNPEVSSINYIPEEKTSQSKMYQDILTFNEMEIDEEYLRNNFTCTYNGWIHNENQHMLKHTFNFNLFYNIVAKDEEKTFKTNEYGIVIISYKSSVDDEVYIVSVKLPLIFSTFTLSKVDEKYNCRRLYNKKYNISLIVKPMI